MGGMGGRGDVGWVLSFPSYIWFLLVFVRLYFLIYFSKKKKKKKKVSFIQGSQKIPSAM